MPSQPSRDSLPHHYGLPCGQLQISFRRLILVLCQERILTLTVISSKKRKSTRRSFSHSYSNPIKEPMIMLLSAFSFSGAVDSLPFYQGIFYHWAGGGDHKLNHRSLKKTVQLSLKFSSQIPISSLYEQNKAVLWRSLLPDKYRGLITTFKTRTQERTGMVVSPPAVILPVSHTTRFVRSFRQRKFRQVPTNYPPDQV